MEVRGITLGPSSRDYRSLFGEHRVYEITEYQRAYSWTEDQWEGVLKNLEQTSRGEQIGWPSILIQLADEPRKDDPKRDRILVGDGQQRIVSVTLLLLAIWHFAKANYSGDAKDKVFLEKLIPSAEDWAVGLIAARKVEHRGPRFLPSVVFQDEQVQVGFAKLFRPILTTFDWDEIESISKENSSLGRIYGAFSYFYRYFEKNGYSLDELEAMVEAFLNNMTLAVLEYGPKENLQSAFADMNSYGISLKQSELIKAELYGLLNQEDPAVAKSFALSWGKNLELGHWTELQVAKTGAAEQIFLDTALREILKSYYPGEHEGYKANDSKYRITRAWNSFYRVSSLSPQDFVDRFESDLELIRIAKTMDEKFEVGSLNWELNYFYQILGEVGRVNGILGFMARIRRNAETEDDLKEILRILIKFYFCVVLVWDENGASFVDYLYRDSDSPFLKGVLNVATVEDYFERASFGKRSKTRVWMSKDKIETSLVATSYKSKNSIICELLVFCFNEHQRAINKSNFRTNSREHKGSLKNSREHILPQNLKDEDGNKEIDREKLDHHEKLVGYLGNSLIIDVAANSSLGDKTLAEKIPIYEKYSTSSAWTAYWLRSFLETAKANPDSWGESAILDRTKIIAKEIAAHIVASKPNLRNTEISFDSLIQQKEASVSDVLYAKVCNEEEWIPLTLQEDSTMLHADGTIFTSTVQLKRYLGFAETSDGSPQEFLYRKLDDGKFQRLKPRRKTVSDDD